MNTQSQSQVSNTPLFETIFTKNKKIFLLLPVALIFLLVGLYFYTNKSEVNDKQVDKTDLTLPTATTKELSDNKIDAMNDFDQLNSAKEEEAQKGSALEIENVNPETSTSQNSNTTYQKADDEVVKKVGVMMAEMNKKPAQSPRQYKNSYSNSSISKAVPSESSYGNDSKDSFDDFFSSSNNKKENNNYSNSQEEITTYAVIKGDQLGVRNNQRVTLLLTKETTVNGKTFPKNTVFYATSFFSSNRIILNINNINQIPIVAKAYDAEDGGLGLQVRQSLIAESSKEAISDGTDEVNVSGIPLGNTMKKIFKRKQQDIKVDLLNNQRLIIKF